AFGPADAKVTVIEFLDLRCPGCKATAPQVLRLMQAHPDGRVVRKAWPLLGGPSNGVSHHAARAALAAHRHAHSLPVYQALIAAPALAPSATAAILRANGVDRPAAPAAMSGGTVARLMAGTQTSAMAMQLMGTPTFFVNGKALESIEPAALDRAIREAKA